MNISNPVSRPASRRIRSFPMIATDNCSTVYVGPNPVIKKTTSMLRKRPQIKTQPKPRTCERKIQPKPKTIPKSASKTQLKQPSRGRSSNDLATAADVPKAPCRKASNPFLRAALVIKQGEPNARVTTKPINTRQSTPDGCMALKAPRRKPSIADMRAPCLPNRKPSNPFLKGFNLQNLSDSFSNKNLQSTTTSPMSLTALNYRCRVAKPTSPRPDNNPFLRGFDIQTELLKEPTRIQMTLPKAASGSFEGPRLPKRIDSKPDGLQKFSVVSQSTSPPRSPNTVVGLGANFDKLSIR